jgi:uncharacterized protein
MDNMLSHLPAKRQEEIQHITELLVKRARVDMIVLFGSHARGDWVSDVYREGHIKYEYDSDYDILVIVGDEDLKNDLGFWRDLEKELSAATDVVINLIVDTIHFVNKKIEEGSYFYLDIKNEGIVLYNSGKFHLSEPLVVRTKKMLQDDLSFWYGKAESFYKDYEHNIQDGSLNNAAFHLSQVTESLYFAVLVVFTGYKLKSHNIEKISQLAEKVVPDLKEVFPSSTAEQREIFDLLKKAYIEARYKQNYEISLDQLEQLSSCIKVLFSKVSKHCSEYIESYKD